MKWMAVLALLFFGCLTARADSTTTTWDFSFYSDTGPTMFSGSGSFDTSDSSIPFYGDPVVSLDGTLNGQPMTLVPALSDALYNGWFDPGALLFSVNGTDYSIYDFDLPLPPFGPGNVIVTSTGYTEGILLTLNDPAPVNTPDPSTILLLCLGLLSLLAGTRLWKLRANL